MQTTIPRFPEHAARAHVCRLRVLLEFTADARLHPFHGPALRAMLPTAWRCVGGDDPRFPNQILPEPIEWGRVIVRAGEPYAFGLTLAARDAVQVSDWTQRLRAGLIEHGARKCPPNTALGGNFRLAQLEDLVAGGALSDGAAPAAISVESIATEAARLADPKIITLRFRTPFFASRNETSEDGRTLYFDRSAFPLPLFLKRLQQRIREHGVELAPLSESELAASCELAANDLVWLRMSYGPSASREYKHGAVGRIGVRVLDPRVLPALLWGRYLRVGEAVSFGLGRYEILEAAPEPYACPPSTRMLERAFAARRPARRTQDDADPIRPASTQICQGAFRPDPHARIPIPKGNGEFRELSVPSQRDRALQRTLLKEIEPAVDAFLEDSSYAYRAGRGRRKLARELQKAYGQGLRIALRADFRRYYDSISHELLRHRLDAYINDDPTVDLLMTWVRAGAPRDGRGIPTGAPLSPLLANLFLDQFDEAIALDGGRLLRYADDFLILFHDQVQAEHFEAAARRAADELLLELNESKSQTLDLNEPFDFLGYRFHRGARWQYDAHARIARIEDLQWYDAAPRSEPALIALPGESPLAADGGQSLAMFGPGPATLRASGKLLRCDYRDEPRSTSVELDRVREVLLLGSVAISHQAAKRCAFREIPVWLADDNGEIFAALLSSDDFPEPEMLAAQLQAAGDPGRTLHFARELVAAKLDNFAALIESLPATPTTRDAAQQHRELLAAAAGADSLDQLRGFEGAAARSWCAVLRERAPQWTGFRRREHPGARDPINILLNIAYTALYRQAAMAARLSGLSPTIGLLHARRSGHMTLASDLMEPFRHVMDRAVLEFVPDLKPGHFRKDPDGPFPVRFAPDVARRFSALLYERWEQPVIARGQTEARSYRAHLLAMARLLRRCLLDTSIPWCAFRHWPQRSDP